MTYSQRIVVAFLLSQALLLIFYFQGCASPGHEGTSDEEGTPSSEIEVCPGEGPRYGDYKCNHDKTHRCCARLLDENGKPLKWGEEGDFWEITGQKDWQWDDKIRGEPNPGDSWCICMWATADLVKEVGCENVHIRCEATDVKFMLNSYHDGGRDLAVAHDCLREKCPEQAQKAGVEPLAAGSTSSDDDSAAASEDSGADNSGRGSAQGSR